MVEASMLFVQVPYTLYKRNKQAFIGFFHPGEFVFGKPFYGFIPLLVT
jgi:hypothetical protein